MASNRTSKAKRASAQQPAELRNDTPTAATLAPGSDATGRSDQRTAIEQAMARQNVRVGRSPGAVGPIGRMVLLIALLTLVGLIAVWVLLAL